MADQCCPMDIYVPGPGGEMVPACTCPDFCECMCLGCACTDWGEEYEDDGELFWHDSGSRAHPRPQLDDGADDD